MEKYTYKKGFILGKFMPVHTGHLFLIEQALANSAELTVLVCSTPREPIDGKLRYGWMQECMKHHQRVKVIHVPDDVPSYPHEHPDFAAIWTRLLRHYLDADTEVIFTSEEYGDQVAEWLSIKHCCIDLNRQTFPVSATQIRENPLAHWSFIPEPVRPYFVTKIVLTGPESTGKSTLCMELAKHYQTQFVAEFGREYFIQKKGVFTHDDYVHIAETQLRLENEAAINSNGLLFCDTDPMVTAIWAEVYKIDVPAKVKILSSTSKYNLHLLLDIDIPWEDDGTREFPHLRNWHFNRIKQELILQKRKFVIISGMYEDRRTAAIQVLDTYLNTAKVKS